MSDSAFWAEDEQGDFEYIQGGLSELLPLSLLPACLGVELLYCIIRLLYAIQPIVILVMESI